MSTATSTSANAALAKLTSLSQALANASDQLSQHIIEMESALEDLNFGLWAWVKDDPLQIDEVSGVDKDGKHTTIHLIQQLGYGKHNGKWAFLVASGSEESWDTDAKISLLRNAPRDIKLRAMDRIPQLLDSLIEEVTRMMEETQQKAQEAKGIATGLRKR